MSNVPWANANNFSIADTLALFDISIDDVNSVNLVNDSRQIKAGDIFCAAIGIEQDGRQYIDQAIKNGAVLVLAQCQQSHQHGNVIIKRRVNQKDIASDNTCLEPNFINVVQFFNLNQHLFEIAKSYYQNPQSKMTMIGITGTNGKTRQAK